MSRSDHQRRLEAAVPAAVARLQATPGVYAALWCGSAARGDTDQYSAEGCGADEYSDLDFHALVTGEFRWRTNDLVDGVPVEVFHNPVHQIRAMFARGEAATIAMFAEGKPVIPHPDLSALMAEAQARFAAGPTPTPVTEALRFTLVDEVMDARAALHRPEHALIALSAASRLVYALYAARGWWDVKRQMWQRDLQNKDPDAAQDLSLLYSAAEPRARQWALEALVRRVTGDLEYRPGQTEPQHVPRPQPT